MRKLKLCILCFTILILCLSSAGISVYAASELNVTEDKALTAKFNRYDNIKISKNKTLTLAKRSGEPVGLEINKSLVVEEGGRITGDGILIFNKAATYSGITLYYKFNGELKKIPPKFSFEQIASDEDYKPTFVFDSKNGVYVLNAEFNGGDPFSIELSTKHLTMLVKDRQQLSLSGITEGVTWKTSKKSVATVSKTGEVTAKKLGNAVITAVYDGQEYSCDVEVVQKGLSFSEIYLQAGDKFFIALNGTGVKAVASTKKSIARINKKLEITAISEGKCTLYVRGTDGIRYKCKVTVEAPGEQQPEHKE